MNNKVIIATMLLVFSFFQPIVLVAQNETNIELGGLNIGDRFDYPIVRNVLHESGSTLELAKYQGKLLILDFWGPGCSACIAAFPKLDSLQEAHKDRIQIIAVNRESLDSTSRYLAKLKNIKTPGFPMITSDSILHQQFPHVFVPHHVWIDTTGRVLFITNGRNTNGKSIRDYLSGTHLELSETRRVRQRSLISSPLLNLVNEYSPQYSLLSSAIPGASVLNRTPKYVDGAFGGNRITCNSAAILDLYIIAYSEGGKYDFSLPNSISPKNIDQSFIRPKADSLFNHWYMNHCFNYDLSLPDTSSAHIYRFMQQDLARYFGYRAKIKRKRRWVYQLRIKDDKLFRREMAKQYPNAGRSDSTIVFHSWKMQDIANYFQSLVKKSAHPEIVVDGTNHEGAVSLVLNSTFLEPFSLARLDEELSKCGLTLVYRKKKVPQLYLKPI